MLRQRGAFHRVYVCMQLVFGFVTPTLWGCMFGCDVMVHVGVHLASEEAFVAVEQLGALLVEDHFT